MRLKDYYRTLGVPSSASAEEVKKAFRTLVLKHHPDRNPDNPFAAGHFIEIREAYHVLSDETRRYQYDQERWLMGMGSRSPAAGRLSAAWVRGEAARLRRHMEQIDTYRMNHEALQQYVLLLLSDEHLAVMKDDELTVALIADVLASIRQLKQPMVAPVTERLWLLAGHREDWRKPVTDYLHERVVKAEKERRFRVLLVFFMLVTGLAALLMISLR